MLKVEPLSGLSAEDRLKLAHRGVQGLREVAADVSPILADVKKRGDAALLEYTEMYDKVKLKQLRVPQEKLAGAEGELQPAVVKAIREAADHIRKFQEILLPRSLEASLVTGRANWRVGKNVVPIPSAGAYVPGGRAVYPSSVLMTCIPAKVAKVKRVILCSPPTADGMPAASVRYAAHVAEVDEVYAVGGPQSIAAMAYGTKSIAAVDKIVGPGSNYVTCAKKMVSEEVAIDFLAGPSEVMVLSDGRSRADLAAAEMVAQAEHDPHAVAVLVTDSERFANEVAQELESQAAELPRRAIIEEALKKQGRIFVADSMDEAIRFANEFAAEHLVILGTDPKPYLDQITCAGSLFIGDYASVALGDYCSGTNHVIPTGGEARRFGALSAADFVREITYQTVTDRGCRQLGPTAIELARAEGLEGHARAVERRMNL